jgi:hypothetical protein
MDARTIERQSILNSRHRELGSSFERSASVVRTPFYDPLRLRTHPDGRGR